MSTVTMTMLEALNKKKLLEQRVAELTNSSAFARKSAYISYVSDKELANENLKIEEAEATLKSNFMARLHAIKNLAEIKSKINESNATTKITVAGKEYTIADAIARHRAIDTEKKFWQECSMQYNTIVTKVEKINADARDSKNVAEHVSTLTSNLTKLPTELIDQLKAAYTEENTVKIIDPNNLAGTLESWKKEIDEFEAELHGAMIESNVKTMITCNFED